MANTDALKVCVVEDNETINRLFNLLLTRAGFTVTVFPQGQPALEFILKEKPDVVLCDIMLPDMNGVEIMKIVRQKDGDTIKMIALTAFARHGDREKYLQHGFDGYIAKPINPETFVDEVKAYL